MRVFLAFLLLGVWCVHATAAERPNIVLIVSDDMGYSDLGCYGGEIETPHLDRLAAGGVRFTNYYVNNMCWPTRASLLTGLYPRTALTTKNGGREGIHPEATTLPEALRGAGYATFMCGKWHLSELGRLDGPQSPHHRGFDRFYGTLEGATDFFAPVDLQLNGVSRTHEWENNPDYYYTDALTDYALRFLREHEEESPNRPFFLYVAYNAAHWPLHAKPQDIARYHGRYAMGWDRLREARHARMKALGVVDVAFPLSARHPLVPAWEDEAHPAWQERRMEVYAAQVTSMDENIGRVLNYLKETGNFENTVVLFQHDNGGCHVEYGPKRTGSWTREFTTDGRRLPIKPGNIPGLMPGPQTTFQSYGYGWANASNTPFRLYKQFDHEGGTRSPLIVSWPRRMPKERHGGLDENLCHALDMMPTLLGAAGIKGLEQEPLPFEGRSFLECLEASRAALGPRKPLFWAHSRGRGVRVGDWKLVAADKGAWELYDLKHDGTELFDLAGAYQNRVQEMAGQHQRWLERTRTASQ